MDQAGKEIGCERVDGEDGGEAVDRGGALSFLVADRGVVDDGIEGWQGVGLRGDVFCCGDAAEVAGNGVCGAGSGCHRVFGALGVAGVEGDAVTLGNQELGGHFAEAVGGAGDKNPGHGAKVGKLTVKVVLADRGDLGLYAFPLSIPPVVSVGIDAVTMDGLAVYIFSIDCFRSNEGSGSEDADILIGYGK
jgi:hypothetical protein